MPHLEAWTQKVAGSAHPTHKPKAPSPVLGFSPPICPKDAISSGSHHPGPQQIWSLSPSLPSGPPAPRAPPSSASVLRFLS